MDKQIVFLKDKELVLRPVLKEDKDRFLIWMNDPEVREWLATYTPKMEKEEEDWIASLNKDQSNIVLMLEVEGKPIGTMGIHRIDWKNRHATTGAAIGEKEYWGKGYGQRAKKLLLKYAFEELGLNKINSFVIEFNERSLKYSKACGYIEEGRQRQMQYRKGKYWDMIWLGITKEDWMKQ